MNRKIYSLLSGAKQSLFALALTVFSAGFYAQNTYTFNYAGSTQQTISLQAGTYTIETWGANGGDNLGNGGTTYLQMGGKGGYSRGTYSLATTTTVYVNVGGRGGNSTTTLNVTVPGGYNGGGYGSLNTTPGKCSGAGGGGASHVATASGLLSFLGTNTVSVLIVGGAGGGAGESNYVNTNTAYNSNGGNAGGLSGLQNPATGYQGRMGQGGTQIAGGGGGDNGSAIAGVPLQGIFGAGGYNTASGTNASAGGAGIGGGGAGWYGGGSGWGGAATAYMAGAGGGGSGYIGGVTSGTTIGFGQLGFVTNPDITGNGKVLITQGCSVIIYGSGTNSLSPSICSGSSLTLTTNAVSGILWSTGGTGASVVVSPTVTTSYSVAGTSSANCVASSNIFITVQTPTSLNVTSTSNSVCLNATVALTASGANTYTWSGGILNGTSFTPSATTIYTLTATNACGTYSTTQTVSVSALPVIAISTSSAVCAGNVATLTAGGATTYTWMPGNIVGVNCIISPLATTIYTVAGTSGPCGGIANITVIAKPNPTVTTSASNSIICAGAQVTLTAFGASTYTWQSGPTISSSLVVSPTAPTAYQVSGTNSLGCSSNSTQVVLVNPSPIINVIASETLICAGGSSTLTASGGSNYTWNFGPTTAAVVVSPTANTVYSVTSAGVGCNTTQTISVDVFTQTLTVSNSTAICMGSSITLNASGGTTYLWSNGGTGSSIFVYPSVSTLYTVSAVTVINNMSCNSTGSVNLAINPNPTVTAVLTRSVICRGESTILTANGANTYVWNNTATTPSFVINPIINTNYTVTGTDANGCKGTGTVQVKVNTCTGISELSNQNGLKIYPNPTNGEFTIESQLAIDLLIINELGQTIKTIQLSSANNLQVKVSDLANGIYFIVGKNKITNINQKIIVNK